MAHVFSVSAARSVVRLRWTIVFGISRWARKFFRRDAARLRGVLMLALGLMLSFAVIPVSFAKAQEHPPVKMGWAPLPPLIYRDDSGEVAGIFAEMHRLLGQEIGFDPQFVEFDTPTEWIGSLASGDTDIFPGIGKIPNLEHLVVYSDPLFEREARFMVRVENAGAINPSDLSGLRVGTVPPTIGSSPSLLPGATIFEFGVPSEAIFALLLGQIDAISAPTFLTFPTARISGVDHQMAFVGPPVAQFNQFVALHQKRKELLEPINQVLADITADGRLLAMQEKHFHTAPDAPPKVLTAGVVHSPPYQVIEDGTFSGFAVEVARELALRANLQIRFKEISEQDMVAGPGTNRYDLLRIEGISPDRATRMDFTLPVDQNNFSIFVAAEANIKVGGMQDLAGLRVGMPSGAAWARTAQNNPQFQSVQMQSDDDLLNALIAGDVQAVIFRTKQFLAHAERAGHTDDIRLVKPPIFSNGLAIAFRPGLGEIRRKFDALIPGFLLAGTYKDLRRTWLEEPHFWTRTRLNILIAMATVFGGGFAGLLIWDQTKRRQRQQVYQLQEIQLELETRHSKQLAELVAELERSNSDLNDFAYVASHDLKEPLRGIAINADFLMREEVSDEVRHRVDRMVELTARMQQLISDLLFFSRLGREERDRRRVNLETVVQGLRLDLREALEEKGGQIRIVSDLPILQLDLSRVKTVFQNLIMNALTYNDSTKKIIEIGFLETVDVDGVTMKDAFFVRDNGIGIDERNHDKVFRIFTRLNRESEYGRGTGAGLSFVKKVVESYGGDITFQSFRGEGTTFYMSLPLAKEVTILDVPSDPSKTKVFDNAERALL